DSLVNYSLMDISTVRGRKDEISFRTRQNINIKIRDIKQYEPFQIALLSNGINDFRASFSSSQQAKAMEQVPLKGLEQAKKEAQIIADKLGRKLGKILEVATQRYRQSLSQGEAITIISDVGTLMEIQQFVEYSTTISVTFELID
ncbi:MAG: SIMPL domain-containing protein, partial [Thermodesulfobacteriota bacterium]